MTHTPRPLTTEEKFLKRARLLARSGEDRQELQKLFTVAVIRVGNGLYGLPVDGVREIIPTPPVAPLPHTEPWFLGITNVRGDLMSVIHLAHWIEVETESKASFLAIIEGTEGPLGLAVEAVAEFRDIFAEEIAKSFDRSQVDSKMPFRATTKDLITILDLGRIANDPRLVVDQARTRKNQSRKGGRFDSTHLCGKIPVTPD